MSLRLLEYFDFSRKKSPLHHVDPRAKLLMIFSLTCFTFYFGDIIPLLMLLLATVPLIILGYFTKKWLYSLLFFVPFLLLIFILNALLLSSPSPTTTAVVIILRLLILSALFGLFFQTVSPDDISQIFIKFKFPYAIAWAMSTAFRFVPTLSRETSIILDAQKSRGLQIDRGNIFKRVRNITTLLVPIFASALRRSWQLAEAIESRGWNATKKRTFLYVLTMKWWDYLLLFLSIVLFAFFLYLAITNNNLPFWLTYSIPERYELRFLLIAFWNWFKGLFNQ